MKWEDEDKGYPTLSALSALNLNLAVRPRFYGFCWGLVEDWEITTDNAEELPIRINQVREAKMRRVLEQAW